jgi:hypothetical protein
VAVPCFSRVATGVSLVDPNLYRTSIERRLPAANWRSHRVSAAFAPPCTPVVPPAVFEVREPTPAPLAIVETYDRCGGSDYVQINFSDPNKAQIQESIWINDSGRECLESEPQCYRK